MLRGVNVGRNSLKMERLREICLGLGFKNTRTYVQSRNIVFEANGAPSRRAAVPTTHRFASTWISFLPTPAPIRSSTS